MFQAESRCPRGVTADLPGSTASGRLTPISTPLRAAWPSCPRDCASWVLEVTRAGPWAQGIDSSFKTLLWSGPLLPPPRVDPKQNGVFRPLGNRQAFSVAGSGLGPGAIGEKGPRREPCPAGVPSGPDSQSDTSDYTRGHATSRGDTAAGDEARFSRRRWASRAGVFALGQKRESEWTGLGRETAPRRRAGPSLPREERRTGEDSGGGQERGGRRWQRAEPSLRCNGIRTGQSLGAFANAIPSPQNACPLTPFGFWLNYHLFPSTTRRLGC